MATDEQAQAVASASAGASGPALFSTAGGGSIKVSDDAIANANRMFGESSSAAATDEQAQAVASASAGASGPALFSTAGGGSIKVSDDAIANANRMFGESSAAAATDEQAQAAASASAGALGPALFSTAGGGSIKISDDAIANANLILGQSAAATCEQPQTGLPSTLSPKASVEALALFSTVGRGSISLSDDAVAKANQMLIASQSMKAQANVDSHSLRPSGLNFSETPAHAATRGGNRASFGVPDANFAHHFHPAESPLAGSSRQTSRHLSTKKVLFREDNAQNASSISSKEHRRSTDAGYMEAEQNEFGFSVQSNTSSAYTPKHTPYKVRKPAAVTRSTTVRNPYASKSATNLDTRGHSSAITPVPFAFRHIEGKFAGKTFSPETIEKAARLLEQPSTSPANSTIGPTVFISRENAEASNAIPSEIGASEHNKDQGGAFRFSIDGTRLSLRQFDARYGPMETDYQRCLERGVQSVILKLNSSNAAKLRFDQETGLPCAFFGASNAPACKMVGSVQDLRSELISQGCDESLLVDKWIVNHFGWINWKLASTERRYPDVFVWKVLQLPACGCTAKAEVREGDPCRQAPCTSNYPQQRRICGSINGSISGSDTPLPFQG